MVFWNPRWLGSGLEPEFWSLSEAISSDLGALEAQDIGIPTRCARISPRLASRPDGKRRLTGKI